MTKQWPWPGDSPIVRARKVAWAYREALREMKPELVDEMDDRFARQWGERWIMPVTSYDPDDFITADEAGALIGISGGTISSLRTRGRIKGVLDGRNFMYRVRDVYKLADTVRRRKGSPTVRVKATGRFAPAEHSSLQDPPRPSEPDR